MPTQILSVVNLRAYWNKAGVRKTFPDWPIDELMYLSIPVLAIRNLDYNPAMGDENYWALSWKGNKNLSLGFWVTGMILKRCKPLGHIPPIKFYRRSKCTYQESFGDSKNRCDTFGSEQSGMLFPEPAYTT